MLPFLRFPSLTKRIEVDVIASIRAQKPGKYWTYQVSDKLAKVGLWGMFWMIFAYVILSAMIRTATHDATPIPAVVSVFGNTILVLGMVGVAASIIRNGLHSELEAIALSLWNSRQERGQ